MDMKTALAAIADGRHLTRDEMRDAMRVIMSGEATPAQVGAFLMGLRMKGETVDEMAGAALVMRELATRVSVSGPHLVDTCGTGGDGAGTFNISTASAFVAAGAGCRVAKHGNRSVSSNSGSADVLEALGVRLELPPERVAECIETVGVGFLFAPQHHSAMRHAVGPRRELGVRTLFNLLGPLTNPAGAPNQVVGVYGAQWVEPVAQVFRALGSEHVLVVHAGDGLDEISIGAPTRVAEVKDGDVTAYTVTPEQFGFVRADTAALRVRNVDESVAMLRGVLGNQPGPARDVVALNAGAAIYAAGVATSLEQGVGQALAVLSSGEAKDRLARLVAFTQEAAPA